MKAYAGEISGFVEKHECAIVKCAMFIAICVPVYLLCFSGENDPSFLFVKIIFCASFLGSAAKGLYKADFQDDMPFSGTRFLKNRPLARVLLNLVILLSVSAAVLAVGLIAAAVYAFCIAVFGFLFVALLKAIF